jgi:hypothetical protein
VRGGGQDRAAVLSKSNEFAKKQAAALDKKSSTW